MPVAISMLRGVNLGPHRRLKMDALRTMYESIGLLNPQTYVQSGNVIFATKERDLAKVAKRIESAIERTFGFSSDVMIRTAEEMRAVIHNNPFAGRAGIEPNKLVVTFLRDEPTAEAREKVEGIKAEPEELYARGRELYIYYANGQARPKLSAPVIEKVLKISGTARNWNSVTKMLEMAEKLEAS